MIDANPRQATILSEQDLQLANRIAEAQTQTTENLTAITYHMQSGMTRMIAQIIEHIQRQPPLMAMQILI